MRKDTDKEKEKKEREQAGKTLCVCLAVLVIVLWHFLGHVPTQRGIPLIQHPTPTHQKTTHHGQHSNKKSTVTQTFLTQKEAAPLMLLTIALHRTHRLT